jgi:fibronectin-binding autotransporter adhesin
MDKTATHEILETSESTTPATFLEIGKSPDFQDSGGVKSSSKTHSHQPMKKSNILRSRSPLAASLAALLLAHLAAPSASAEIYYWDNNGATLGFGTAAGTWAVPTVGSESQGWSTSSTGELLPGNVTTTFSDGVRFGSATDTIAGGTVTVNGTVEANSILYTVNSGVITLSGGTIALGGTSPQIRSNRVFQVIESGIQLNANTQIIAGINGNPVLHFEGQISGNHNVTFNTPTTVNGSSGQNTFIRLSAANLYTGNTTITTANINNHLFVQSFVNNALPPTTVLTLDGGAGPATATRRVELNLNGNHQALAGLTNIVRTNRQQQVVNSGAAADLTLNTTASFTFSGNIAGNISLTKSGIGSQTLAASNSYNGATTISEGKLVGVVGGHHQNSAVTVDNELATYGISINNSANSWTCKSLTYEAAGTLEFNFGAVAPSASISPLLITELADFTLATPEVAVIFTAPPLPGIYPLMTWGSVDGAIPESGNLSVTGLGDGTEASLSVMDDTLNLVITGTAPGVVKANNTDNLNLGSSWVGNAAPTPDDIAVWNSTVTSANTTVLGGDLTWSGMKIENPSGPVTINTGNTLALGSAPVDIDMSAATADLTLNCPLNLTAANVWKVTAGRTLSLTGGISGAFPVTKQGEGSATLSGLNTYTGNTIITEGTLRLAEDETLPYGAGFGNTVVNGTLDLNGKNQGINALTGSGIVDNTASNTSSILTVGYNNASGTFNGILKHSGNFTSMELVKTGSGALVLGGVNTFEGPVTVNGGTLAFSKTDPLGSVSNISLAGGTTLRPDVANAIIYAPITVGASGTTVTINAPTVDGAGTTPVLFTVDSALTGDGNVRFYGTQSTNGYGTVILRAPSEYAGSTLLDCSGANMNIFVRLDTGNALPATTVVTLDGGNGGGGGRFCDLNLNGNNQTIAGLTNVSGLTLRTQQLGNRNATPATLTVNNTDDFTYSARIGGVPVATNGSNGNNLGLTKSGPGTLTLSGSNTYTGATTITGGTLALGASNVLANVTAVSIGNAALAIGNGSADILGTLEVTGNATIHLGTGAALAFASDSPAWSGALTITGNFVSGSSLRFGTDANGLTSAQIAAISGPGLSGIDINSEGYLTATVEAGGYTTWAANVDNQGPELDYDGDGVANGVEYFLNAPAGFTALPTLDATNSITWTNGGNIPASAYGSQFVIQTSGNLAAWTDVLVGDLAANTDGPGGSLTYTLTGPAPRFVRLKVMPE